jgi:hypothetical protein
MKVYWGVEVKLTHFFHLSTRWRWVVSFTPWPLYPQGRSPRYPLDRRLVGPQSWSGGGGEEKNSQLLPGLEPPVVQPVAQLCITELSRFLIQSHTGYNSEAVPLEPASSVWSYYYFWQFSIVQLPYPWTTFAHSLNLNFWTVWCEVPTLTESEC